MSLFGMNGRLRSFRGAPNQDGRQWQKRGLTDRGDNFVDDKHD